MNVLEPEGRFCSKQWLFKGSSSSSFPSQHTHWFAGLNSGEGAEKRP